jgi:hypothetical protein
MGVRFMTLCRCELAKAIKSVGTSDCDRVQLCGTSYTRREGGCQVGS